jgi:hypothetical protein
MFQGVLQKIQTDFLCADIILRQIHKNISCGVLLAVLE